MSEANGFIERIERHLVLTREERNAVANLCGNVRTYRRGAIVRRERDRAQEIFLLSSGWVISFVLLDDGSRQILKVHLPGDLLGLSSTAFAEATESLMTVTDARLLAIDKAGLRDLFVAHPRIGAMIFILAQAEQASLNDRLASLGRTSGKSRVAALLLDTMTRLRITQRSTDKSISFPLTQEEIGDATGLTAVHVNRMIRALVEEGLLARQASRLTIVDEKRLEEVANYVNRDASIDVNWLPPAKG